MRNAHSCARTPVTVAGRPWLSRCAGATSTGMGQSLPQRSADTGTGARAQPCGSDQLPDSAHGGQAGRCAHACGLHHTWGCEEAVVALHALRGRELERGVVLLRDGKDRLEGAALLEVLGVAAPPTHGSSCSGGLLGRHRGLQSARMQDRRGGATWGTAQADGRKSTTHTALRVTAAPALTSHQN